MSTVSTEKEIDLLAAIERSDTAAALALVEKGADTNFVSQNGWTPLMLAVLFDLRALVQTLLAHGADPNKKTDSWENPSRTAVLVAINNARVEMLELLLQSGVDIHYPIHGQADALIWARRLQKRSAYKTAMEKVIALLESYSAST